MSAPHWPRPHWQAGAGEAFLLWFVFGDFAADLHVDAERYRTRGTPPGVEVVRYVNRELARWDGYPLAGTLGRVLYDENAPLFERAQRARECVMLRGSLADPPDLDALRDLVGAIAALTDAGAVAVVDPQILSLFDADAWRRRFFDGDAFRARDHVLILLDDDAANAGRLRVHTRGLRKFARPDLDLRNVPPAAAGAAGELVERLVEFQALGGRIEDGRTIEIDGAAHGLVARTAGAPADPEFNNRHVALRWPD
ncbi:MAG TPA: hypothetical protein VGC30_14425 [Dokdonella sp.]